MGVSGLTELAAPPALTIRSARTRGVRVPLTFALGTSVATIRTVPLLLLDLLTDEGITGRAYIFCYTAANARAVAGFISEALEMIRGRPVAPALIGQELCRRLALLGVIGPVRMALSAIDIALWDALAIACGQPVATLLGGAPRPVRAYDSRGLGLMPPKDLAREAELLLASGLKAVKVRLGYPTLGEDLAALAAVRARISEAIPVMVDYNQALTLTEALLRGPALQAEGLIWLEEPIRHDDYRGNAMIARSLDLPLQIGENFNGPEAMLDALTVNAADYVMPDVSRIGGVTGWMRAAAIASARGIEMSSHLMPEISIHLLAATPTAHWLEYVDWADALLKEPLRIENGAALVPDRPGFGIEWDEARIGRLETL